MEYVQIAGIERRVSRVGLGTWAIGGWMWGGAEDAESIRTIHAALDRGITLIDTAPVYGFGHSEEVVGRALAQSGRRHDAVVATKAGLEWRDGKVFRNASRERLVTEVEDSLRRLGVDRIDLLQIHWPDPLVPADEVARTVEDLRRQGKVAALGVSNFSVEQMEAFRGAAPLASAQPPYNLFERAIEKDVLPWCARNGVATLLYGALCRGLLSGRMRPDTTFTGDDLRRADPKFRAPRYAQYLGAVGQLDALAQARFGKRVIHLAVRWMLDQPGATVALWGARRPDQLDPVEGAMGWRLDDAAKAEVDRILRDCIQDPVGPEFMAPPARKVASR